MLRRIEVEGSPIDISVSQGAVVPPVRRHLSNKINMLTLVALQVTMGPSTVEPSIDSAYHSAPILTNTHQYESFVGPFHSSFVSPHSGTIGPKASGSSIQYYANSSDVGHLGSSHESSNVR